MDSRVPAEPDGPVVDGPDGEGPDSRWRDLPPGDRAVAAAGVGLLLLAVAGILTLPVLGALLIGAKVWPSAIELDGWTPALVAAAGITFAGWLAELLTTPLSRGLRAAVPGPGGGVAEGAIRVLVTAGVALICLRVTPGVRLDREEFVLVLGVVSAAADAIADRVSSGPA